MTLAMTLAYAAALAGVFGLIIGSFLNVVAYRLPRGESLSLPALALPELRHADQALRQRAGALVAVAARALPRAASSSISARYPIVEAVTAALLVRASCSSRAPTATSGSGSRSCCCSCRSR